MSALKTITDEPALRAQPIAHDRARALLGRACSGGTAVYFAKAAGWHT
jgi:hypothetical protein